MKLSRFGYIVLIGLCCIPVFIYLAYAAVVFDTDVSSIWYGPLHTSYTNQTGAVSTNNTLDGGPITCLTSGNCGDGIVNGNDVCDKADTTNKINWGVNGCNNICFPINAAVCGDGIITTPETCDDGTLNGHPGKCNTTCDAILPECGNTIVEGTEECDEGPSGGPYGTTGDRCTQSCKIKHPVSGGGGGGSVVSFCGDDDIDTGESCDDGVNNSDTTEGACKLGCMSGRVPISCVGCSCDNSCPTVSDTTPSPDISTPPPAPSSGESSNSF